MPDADDAVEETPARPFWSGTITFGLVSVPVNVMAAYRANRVPLRMVSSGGRPLARRYFTSREGAPLEWDGIVRGYEVEDGRFVVLEDEELERLAPEKTRDIDLRVFVDVSEIDPKYFERAYYLTPAGQSTKAYRLLARVMEDTGRAGIATFVMRAKEYLVAIIAENGILRAEMLRFAGELRSPRDVGLPKPAKPPASDVRRMEKAIAALEEDALDPSELADRSARRLNALVSKKAKAGKDVVELERSDESAGSRVLDLVEILNRSLAGANRNGGDGPRRGRTDLAALSKAELYERAKRRNIAGRSGMSKEELVRALEG